MVTPSTTPGDSPLCGEDVVDALCTYEPEAVAGCMPCLEFVAEDLTDHHFHQGTCLHCREKIITQGELSGVGPSVGHVPTVGSGGGSKNRPCDGNSHEPENL